MTSPVCNYKYVQVLNYNNSWLPYNNNSWGVYNEVVCVDESNIVVELILSSFIFDSFQIQQKTGKAQSDPNKRGEKSPMLEGGGDLSPSGQAELHNLVRGQRKNVVT